MILPPQKTDVISVAMLNRMAKELLETALPPCWIAGEISNLTIAASGHAYFSLKDKQAQIRCVMFRNRLSTLNFRPKDGMQVELRGSVTLYEARGEYQINVEAMRQAGIGSLFEAFLQLKGKLEAEGLFDNQHKKALPAFPATVGIITSPAAAALRDVVTTFRRRMPSIKLILYPALVQGAQAAEQLAAAIWQANQRHEVDVLLLCRGGGSLEDLWAFNEEPLARAIFASTLPVVSGVGHETDFTIADFVADQRAATPTAAAELISPNQLTLLAQQETLRRQLERAISRLMTDKGQQLDYLSRRLRHPGERLQQQQKHLAMLQTRLRQACLRQFGNASHHLQKLTFRLQQQQPQLPSYRQGLDHLQSRLQQSMKGRMLLQQHRLSHARIRLEALNPEAVLARGFAIVQHADGRLVKHADALEHGDMVKLRFADSETRARIEQDSGTQHQLPF